MHAHSLRRFAIVAVALFAFAAPGAAPPTAPPATFRNPIKLRGADPWLQYVDGYYHLATTSGRDVRLRRAKRMAELKDAKDEVVWKDDAPERSHGVWAPEFHHLDGKWYLYVTAFDGKDDADHRLFVAQSTTDGVMGPYKTKAKLRTDPDDKFYAIDGTVLTWANGTRYFVWCGRPSPAGQGLYIARMENPWTLAGERVYLEASGFGCRDVREGPVFLYRNGRVFLVYSMCAASTPDSRLGMLVAHIE
jgi:GH43 family beta-xylosidase